MQALAQVHAKAAIDEANSKSILSAGIDWWGPAGSENDGYCGCHDDESAEEVKEEVKEEEKKEETVVVAQPATDITSAEGTGATNSQSSSCGCHDEEVAAEPIVECVCNGTSCVCTVTTPDDTPIPTEPPVVNCVCNDTTCVCTVEDNIGNGSGSLPGEEEEEEEEENNSTTESNCTKKCEDIAAEIMKLMNDTKLDFKKLKHEVKMNYMEADAKWDHLSSEMSEFDLK